VPPSPNRSPFYFLHLLRPFVNAFCTSFPQQVTCSFTDQQPLVLTATVMERMPTLPLDVFPQEYYIDYVRIYAWEQ